MQSTAAQLATINTMAPMDTPRRRGESARVLFHRSTVHIEVDCLSEAAVNAIERAMGVIAAEVGESVTRSGPSMTEMIVPPLCYGSVAVTPDGVAPRSDRVIAACAMARALLRDAGFTL